MIEATLVTGGSAGQREAVIAEAISGAGLARQAAGSSATVAVLAEGLPDGKVSGALSQSASSPTVLLARIAPGCLCCTGNLTMRVTLNRLLRKKPGRLFIALADITHLDEIRTVLSQPPYDSWLALTADLQV
jgi:G3E family GTPase